MSCGAPGTPSRPPAVQSGSAVPAPTIRAVLAALATTAALTLPLWLESPYFLHVVIMAGVFGGLALSLNPLLGHTGGLSLGPAPLFRLGAPPPAPPTLPPAGAVWLARPPAGAPAPLARRRSRRP